MRTLLTIGRLRSPAGRARLILAVLLLHLVWMDSLRHDSGVAQGHQLASWGHAPTSASSWQAAGHLGHCPIEWAPGRAHLELALTTGLLPSPHSPATSLVGLLPAGFHGPPGPGDVQAFLQVFRL